MAKRKSVKVKESSVPSQRSAQQAPTIPGAGVSGKVICPFLSIAGRDVLCYKERCEMWVELHQEGKGYVGRCGIAWNTVLMTEVRGAIDRLNAKLTPEKSNKSNSV